jgi:hypothetical protein
MADPGSPRDHISLTRDAVLIKLGVPYVVPNGCLRHRPTLLIVPDSHAVNRWIDCVNDNLREQTILTTIDQIMQRRILSFDVSNALPTLLETMEPRILPRRRIQGYCIACCRLLELYIRRRVQDQDETPNQSWQRIDRFFQSLNPVPMVPRQALLR